MKKHLCILISLVLAATSVGAQSAAIMDTILAEEHLSYGHAAYLILGTLNQLPENTVPIDATEILHGLGMGFPGTPSEDELNLGRYALLIMQALEIDGGYLYTLSANPRYAARELEFLGAIQGRAFPGMALSGERGLRILNRTLALREEGRL